MKYTFYPSGDEFGSKQRLDEADKMVVELWLILLLKILKAGQSQNDDLFGVPLCPVIYQLENSLNKKQGSINQKCLLLYLIVGKFPVAYFKHLQMIEYFNTEILTAILMWPFTYAR